MQPLSMEIWVYIIFAYIGELQLSACVVLHAAALGVSVVIFLVSRFSRKCDCFPLGAIKSLNFQFAAFNLHKTFLAYEWRVEEMANGGM